MAVLLARLLSLEKQVTVAVLVTVVPVKGRSAVTAKMEASGFPRGMSPRARVHVELGAVPEHDHPGDEAVAEKVVPGGTVSWRVAWLAVAVPMLVTVRT